MKKTGLRHNWKVGQRVMLAMHKKIADGESLWVTGEVTRLVGWNDHYEVRWDYNQEYGNLAERDLVTEEEGQEQIRSLVAATLAF